MKKLLLSLFILVTITSFAEVLPRDSELMVRMDTTINSKSAYDGQIFTGTLQSNVSLEGGGIIPQGSKVFGRVIEADSAGHLTGSSKLAIIISEVQLKGFNYGINTNAIGFEGASQGKDTLTKTLGAAAIGGLFNKARGSSGSKGLKVGGAVGAGAGLLTSGKSVAINQGDILEFRTTTSTVVGS